MGIFARILTGLAEQASNNKTISIDATYLKAHRTASSRRLKKGGEDDKRRYKRRNRSSRDLAPQFTAGQ
jgi:hypothetical protein